MQDTVNPSEEEISDYILNPEMDMPTQEIDGQDYIGTLVIESLGLSLPIISEWSYPRLRIAPCRYAGSAYLDNMVIAAHNYIKATLAISKIFPKGTQLLLQT